ncbi:Ig-like domain-containing protein [Pontibacter rugosus]
MARSGSCEVISNTIIVDVEELPAAPTAQGITTICFGGGTILTATAPGGTYTWYTQAGVQLQEGAALTVTGLDKTTTYLVSSKSALGCEGPKTAVTVYVAPALANNNISGEQTVCSGSSVLALSGSLPTGGDGTNYTYFWEYSTDEGATYQTAPGDNTLQDYTPIGTFTNNTWYRRKVSSEPCAEVISNVVKITVVPLPDAPVVQNTQACYGSKVTLAVENPVNGVKYRWYDASGAVVKNGNTYDTPILTSTSNYAVEAILDNASACVSSSRTAVTVTVIPAMMGGDIISTPKPVVCKGSSPGALSGDAPTGGTGTYTYQWYASTTNSTSGFDKIENATDQAYTPQNMQETTWYKREVYSSTCKKESIIIRVVVEVVPAAPTVQGIREVCYGGSTVLTAQGQGGSYNWYDENNVQIHTGTAPYYGQNLTRSRTFYVEAESATGCTSPRTEVNITVVPVLTNTISADKAICENEDPGTIGGMLSGGNGPDSYKIRWEYSSGGSAFTAAPGSNNEPSYSPGPLSVTTTYRRVVESGDCEQRSNSVTISIANTIAGNTISGGGTICAGGSPGTVTGNGSTGFSYQWYASTTSATTGFQPISVNGTNRDYTPAALLETTWFQREIISGNCSSMSNTILVTVEKAITNNSIRTSVTEVCIGGKPGTITGEEVQGGNGSPTYLWQWTKVSEPGNYKPAPGANTGKDYVPIPNDPALNLTEAVYFRRIVTAGLCSPSESNEILVSVIPTVVNGITTASNTLCVNEAPQFVSATPVSGGKPGNYTYRWERSLNGGAWGTVANTEDYTPTDGLAAGTWQYRRWIGSGGCSETLSNVLTIKVNPAITGNQLAAVAPVCVGTTVTLSGTATIAGGDNTRYEYLWEQSVNGTNYFTLTGEAGDKLTIPIVERSWFRRTVKSGNCVSVSVPVEVQVQQPIAVQITGAQSLCLGTPLSKLAVTILAGGGSSNKIQWMKSDTEGGIYASIPGATANEYLPTAVTRPTWFKVKVTGSACQDGWSNAVKVEFYPAIVNRIGDSQTICQGSAAAIIGSTQTITGGAGADSYTFQWLSSIDGTNFTIITGAPNADSYTPQNVTKRTWFKRVVYSASCSNESDAVEVNVQTPPVNKISIANDHICSGTIPAPITSETLGGTSEPYTFVWQQSTDGVTYRTISGAVDATYQPQALTRTTWFKRIVRSKVCGEITGNDNVVRIQVDQPVKDNFIVTKPAAVCVGQAIPELKGSNPTGGNGNPTYLWMASVQGESIGFAPAAGDNKAQHYQPRNVERTTWYKRMVYAAPCQESESPVVKLEVAPKPDIPTAEAVTVCLGTSATLTAKAAAAGDVLQWYDAPTGGKLLGTSTTYTSAKLYNNTSFYVQATNQSNCVSSSRFEVKVQIVEPKAEASEDVTVVEGKAVELWAKGGVSYSWSPVAGLTDPTSATPKASPKETTTYTVTVTTAEGCTASAKVTVTVSPKVLAANVITPNGDNKNDRFKIMHIENYPDCRVEIFSRWGEKVFESKGYSELQEWDGTRNGQLLPMAAYYYIIYLNNGEEPISGSVTLIR